jgi:hypothetical protein
MSKAAPTLTQEFQEFQRWSKVIRTKSDQELGGDEVRTMETLQGCQGLTGVCQRDDDMKVGVT